MDKKVKQNEKLNVTPQSQQDRRSELFRLHRKTYEDVDADSCSHLGQRVRMWHAIPWLADSDSDPERIERFIIGNEPWGKCAFAPAVAMQLLVRWSQTMSDGLRLHLENYVSEWLDHEAAAWFKGKNDNFPAMSSCCLTLAAAYFNDTKREQQALTVLQSGMELLQRRDYLSEYLSTTYSPITLAMFAEIANYAESDKLREMGANMESRLWHEVLSHWHVGTCSLAGPHSRSYQRDSLAHVHQLHSVLYICLGKEWIPLNPVDFLYPPPSQQVIHNQDLAFVHCGVVWLANSVYHPDTAALDYLTDQQLPRTEIGTAECAVRRDIVPPEANFDPPGHGLPYPPAVHHIVSHLSENFTLGTASHDWLEGNQHDAFSIKISTDHQKPRPQPPRVVFSRFVSGRKSPGEENYYPDLKKEKNRNVLIEEGRRHCVQHANVALVAYWPNRRLQKAQTDRLSLNILSGCHFSRPDELRVGNETVTEKPVTAAEPQPLFLREGNVFIALLPLTVTDMGREKAVWAGRRGDYLVAEWINYEGAPRQFAEHELMGIQNGFAAVAEEAEGRNFDQWCEEVAEARPNDNMLTADIRILDFTYQSTRLALNFNQATECAQYVTVNGEAVDCPPYRKTN